MEYILKIKHLIISINLIVILLIGIFVWYESQREYIGGNVIHVALIDDVSSSAGRFPSVWKNSGLISSFMFRTLFKADSTSTIFKEDLAKSYEILDRGLTYKITLKSDLKWSDGRDIIPEDVKSSVEAVCQGDFVNAIYIAAFNKINFIEIDGYTITFHLKEKHHAFMSILSQFIILPKHVLDGQNLNTFDTNDYWKNPIVSGMYKISTFTPEKHFKLTHNPLYTGKKPHIDEVYLHFNFNQVKLDYYSTNTTSEMVSFRAMRGYAEYEIAMLFYRYFVYNMQDLKGHRNDAMCDLRVRQALAYAINKEKLFYNIYFQIGRVIDAGIINDTLPKDQMYAYDPVKAKELLIEAGYDFNRPIRMTYYYLDDISRYFMAQVAKCFEEIGLKVEIFRAHNGASDLYEKREYDIFLKGLAAFTVDEWYTEYTSTNPYLSHLFGDVSEFDNLVSTLHKEFDEQKRSEIFEELVTLEQERLYKLPLFILDQAVYVNTNRLSIPSDTTFGNTWYMYDLKYEDWSVKKQ